MRFGQLAGTSSINSRIYASLECIHPDDVASFVRKFRSEKGAQLYHTLHELTMGAELWRRGVPMRYERQIEGKTPDWSLQDLADEVTEIFDVTALHQRHTIEADMLHTLSRGEIWSGWISIPPDHIYSKIEQKAGPYANLVGRLGIPYVIGIFGEFTASIDPEELHCVLFSHHGGSSTYFRRFREYCTAPRRTGSTATHTSPIPMRNLHHSPWHLRSMAARPNTSLQRTEQNVTRLASAKRAPVHSAAELHR